LAARSRETYGHCGTRSRAVGEASVSVTRGAERLV